MPRRGHKKSRAGCVDCKRRHVKCDETRPCCVNCKVASLKCSYLRAAPASETASQTASLSATATPAYSPLTPDAGSSTSSANTRADKATSKVEVAQLLNMDHLELLHHYDTLTFRSFTTNDELSQTFRRVAVANALRFPFLMHAILALSAMHLCRIYPDRAEHYRALASSLQAAGLAGLNDTLMNITEDNCMTMFIFATTTGLHSFCETFTFRDNNFSHFLDKLTNCIQLMRGVRSVMGGGWWDYLRTTSLADLFASGAVLGEATVDRDGALKPLWDLISISDLSAASEKIYEDAITQLQRVFNAEAQQDKAENSISMVFAWPVILTAEYNDLLIQRRPEALVILAYYGIILHKRREAWAVRDSGQYLINAISDYLGKHWERWLVWPLEYVSGITSTTASNTPT